MVFCVITVYSDLFIDGTQEIISAACSPLTVNLKFPQDGLILTTSGESVTAISNIDNETGLVGVVIYDPIFKLSAGTLHYEMTIDSYTDGIVTAGVQITETLSSTLCGVLCFPNYGFVYDLITENIILTGVTMNAGYTCSIDYNETNETAVFKDNAPTPNNINIGVNAYTSESDVSFAVSATGGILKGEGVTCTINAGNAPFLLPTSGSTVWCSA